jgi:hypothetical protein
MFNIRPIGKDKEKVKMKKGSHQNNYKIQAVYYSYKGQYFMGLIVVLTAALHHFILFYLSDTTGCIN